MKKICAISDSHNQQTKLIIPECDILIHAGDWTYQGGRSEVKKFAQWLDKQTQCKEIIVIPGNHELYFEKELPSSMLWFTDNCSRAKLLIDSGCEIDGIKIWGSPVTPFFHDWAWNRVRFDIKKHWDAIPNDTNILITHGPPYGILDQTTFANGDIRPGHLGCDILMERVKEIKPDLHFFGHIHAEGGKQAHAFGTSFYNCAVCDETYSPTNPITIVDYKLENK